MGARRGGKATRPDDKRLKANRPKKEPKYKSRWQQLMDGDLTVEELDDEEIKKGRCKDRDGQFRGRPPKEFPRALHDALHNEFMRRTEASFKPLVELATQALVEITQNRRAAAPARVQAANILLERGAGKVTDKVMAEVITKKFEENIEGLFVDVPDEVAKKRQEKAG